MDITNFDLTKGLGPSKKCWYLCPPNSRKAIAEMIGGKVACDGRVLTPEEINKAHRVSQTEELGPGDWHEDHDYTFSGGA